MKNLIIKTIGKETIIYEGKAYYGKIILEDYTETLYIPVEYWSIHEYRKQWKEGLMKIKTEDASCIVTAVEINNNIITLINWWVLYKRNNMIIIENHTLFYENLQKFISGRNFTIFNCYNFIPEISNTPESPRWFIRINPKYYL